MPPACLTGRRRRSDYLVANDSGGKRTGDRKTKERTKIMRCGQTRDVQARKIGLKFGVEAGVSFGGFERIEDRRPVEKRNMVHIIPTCIEDYALAQSRRPMDMMIQGWSIR